MSLLDDILANKLAQVTQGRSPSRPTGDSWQEQYNVASKELKAAREERLRLRTELEALRTVSNGGMTRSWYDSPQVSLHVHRDFNGPDQVIEARASIRISETITHRPSMSDASYCQVLAEDLSGLLAKELWKMVTAGPSRHLGRHDVRQGTPGYPILETFLKEKGRR